ncbi:protein of unknown function (plasmid) [Caballeronia sp. S22]
MQAIVPTDTMRRAAELMDELNVGALSVCDCRRLKGVMTDRDIVVRAIAVGKDSSCLGRRQLASRWNGASDTSESKMRCAGWSSCGFAA